MAPAGFRLLCVVVLLSSPMVLAQVTPTLSCSAEPAKVYIGELITLSSTASTSSGHTLVSVWGTTAGRLEGNGPTVKLDTTGVAPGSYTATVRADDGRGGFADCTVHFTPEVRPPPKPPVVSCSSDKTSVNTGEVVNLQATAASPDNRPLSYGWTVLDGQIAGSGAAVRWDTSGLPAGTYDATGRISDDRSLSVDCTVTIDVLVPPPPPESAMLGECAFRARSSRVNNVCKGDYIRKWRNLLTVTPLCCKMQSWLRHLARRIGTALPLSRSCGCFPTTKRPSGGSSSSGGQAAYAARSADR